MMAHCILFGHSFDTFPGVGDYAGQMFRVCIHCGRTEPIEAPDQDMGRPDLTARIPDEPLTVTPDAPR